MGSAIHRSTSKILSGRGAGWLPGPTDGLFWHGDLPEPFFRPGRGEGLAYATLRRNRGLARGQETLQQLDVGRDAGMSPLAHRARGELDTQTELSAPPRLSQR